MTWVKIDEILMSAKPNSDFLKIIWDPRKISVVSDIVLYRGALYRDSSVFHLQCCTMTWTPNTALYRGFSVVQFQAKVAADIKI